MISIQWKCHGFHMLSWSNHILNMASQPSHDAKAPTVLSNSPDFTFAPASWSLTSWDHGMIEIWWTYPFHGYMMWIWIIMWMQYRWCNDNLWKQHETTASQAIYIYIYFLHSDLWLMRDNFMVIEDPYIFSRITVWITPLQTWRSWLRLSSQLVWIQDVLV